ncbi:MAG: DUF6567 family protein [Planctomycetota bacterium]
MTIHQNSNAKRKVRRETKGRCFVPAKRGKAALSIICLVLIVVSSGCTSSGTFPHESSTRVDLSRGNYRVVKANAVGSSSGFKLLMFIPIVAPKYNKAMGRLQKKAGVAEGTSQAIVNVAQEKSSLYLLLFSIPKITVRADIIEFTD